ncbi:MAG: cytochrome c biogenesis protein CcdA [Candidatus Omnitrophica bacterium]|nr:cytochrome c biogenesis protein CcdA [Candidatus Omnitrophota bacterium]MDD5592914.1 cytochrome c biogenesis protein CcdA [Candidatus Omnitrophota bacterium]
MILPDNSLTYIGAFLGGLGLSFSPCVYPLVPVTLGFIGVEAGSSRLRGFIFSLVYVSGIAVTYSILGLVASLSAGLFGRISTHPVSFLIIGNACIISGLSFFDVIHINFSGIRLQHKIKMTGGILSVFLLGLTSGLVISPCTAPALGTILLYVATRQNIFYGASLLFVFAYGMGFLLILTGTFSSIFMNLSKSHAWLKVVKKLSGFIMLGIGEYFLIMAGRLMW